MKVKYTMISIGIALFLFPSSMSKTYAQADPQQVTKETFKGKISLDVRDS